MCEQLIIPKIIIHFTRTSMCVHRTLWALVSEVPGIAEPHETDRPPLSPLGPTPAPSHLIKCGFSVVILCVTVYLC